MRSRASRSSVSAPASALEIDKPQAPVGLLDDPFLGTAPDRTERLLTGPTAAYRALAARNMLRKVFLETQGVEARVTPESAHG